jgi:iron complex outermembrane recepter protein
MIATNKKYLALLLMGSGMIGHAQAADRVLEEIVVTAQKRSESIQNVPIAIEAFSEQKLESANITQLIDLPRISPSLNTSDNSYLNPYIRGIGSTNTGTGIYSSVAIYQDGVYMPRLSQSLGDLDVESIQILKGPQGALYGRNATGGAILITTRNPVPGDDIEGKIEGTVGNYDRQGLRASVYGGLTDTLAFSLSAVTSERDGWTKKLPSAQSDSGDGNADDNESINFKLVFDPTDRLHFKLAGAYSKAEAENVLYEQLAVNDAPHAFAPFGITEDLNGGQTLAANLVFGVGLGIFGLDATNPADFPAIVGVANSAVAAAQGIEFSNKFGESYDNQIGGWTNGVLSGGKPDGSYRESKSKNLSLDARYNFDAFDLVSITGWGEHDFYGSTEVLNADPTTVDFSSFFLTGANVGFSADDYSDFYSQEIMVVSSDASDIDWIAGVYYFNEDGRAYNALDIFGISAISGDSAWEVESKAVYGQMTYPLTERLSLTAGARYTKEEYTLEDKLDPEGPFNILRIPNLGTRDVESSKSTFSLKLDYQAEDWLVYGSVSTGFKSGGLNPQFSGSLPVEPEEITAYEVGTKTEWLDSRLRLNGALFYYEYEEIQMTAYDVATGGNFSINAPKAEITGLDVEIDAAVTDSLQVFGGFTVLDSEIKGDAPIAGTGGVLFIDGHDLPYAASLRATGGFNYYVPGIDELRLTANIAYTDGYWLEVSNTVGTQGSEDDDGYTTVNLNTTYTNPNGWYLTLFANNLFDEEYYSSGVVISNVGQSGVAGPGRNYGATLGMKF